MGLYDTFETDENLETNGVIVDYGDFRIKIAAAGPANKNYALYAEKKLKPVRRALETGALSNDRSMAIMADIFSKTVILGWETKVEDEWKSGIEQKGTTDLLPFNEENVMKTLISLPRLFTDIQTQAQSMENFRAAGVESDSKN